MERDLSDLPPLPPRPDLEPYFEAYHREVAEAEHAHEIKKQIAVALMMRSGLPITAVAEALGLSRPTLYAWRNELAPPATPENEEGNDAPSPPVIPSP